MAQKTAFIEVYEDRTGTSLTICDGQAGYRLAGGKVTLKTLKHRFEVDLDELIREATNIRDAEDDDED